MADCVVDVGSGWERAAAKILGAEYFFQSKGGSDDAEFDPPTDVVCGGTNGNDHIADLGGEIVDSRDIRPANGLVRIIDDEGGAEVGSRPAAAIAAANAVNA